MIITAQQQLQQHLCIPAPLFCHTKMVKRNVEHGAHARAMAVVFERQMLLSWHFLYSSHPWMTAQKKAAVTSALFLIHWPLPASLLIFLFRSTYWCPLLTGICLQFSFTCFCYSYCNWPLVTSLSGHEYRNLYFTYCHLPINIAFLLPILIHCDVKLH